MRPSHLPTAREAREIPCGVVRGIGAGPAAALFRRGYTNVSLILVVLNAIMIMRGGYGGVDRERQRVSSARRGLSRSWILHVYRFGSTPRR